MPKLFSYTDKFTITIEVVPPHGNDPASLLDKLNQISYLPFHGFSVASNPVAKPKMSALVFAHLLQTETQKPVILHFTVRDHNRLGLQSELWGAKALGLDTIIAVTGDPSASVPDNPTTTVNDLNVFDLITMGRHSNLHTGAVLDYRPEVDGLDHEIKRIERKIAAGCRFIVTQPIYDEKTAKAIYSAAKNFNTPVIMGILPLLSFKHAVFLNDKVAGIAVPKILRSELKTARHPINKGVVQSIQMLNLAKKYFSGACIMPPFERFDILPDILDPNYDVRD
ncbi:MAG: methylenetetrahydrofolate reductase [Desulfobacula sp.]|nr:methylenetetrahydrofolate reductase [Desulfobacula sp.]